MIAVAASSTPANPTLQQQSFGGLKRRSRRRQTQPTLWAKKIDQGSVMRFDAPAPVPPSSEISGSNKLEAVVGDHGTVGGQIKGCERLISLDQGR